MKKINGFKKSDIVIGLVFTLLFISLGVIFTINFRPLYYLDIKLLSIPEISGYPRDEIIANYNALIDYSSPFFRGSLSFPTLISSPSGIQHFKEVKDIFVLFYGLAGFSLIAAVTIIIYKSRKKDISYLAAASLSTIILPIIVGLLIAIDFDAAFSLFHKLFFKNDYWLFDPATDPVITILPDTFFLHCALLIIIFILICSLISFLLYRHLKGWYRSDYNKQSAQL